MAKKLRQIEGLVQLSLFGDEPRVIADTVALEVASESEALTFPCAPCRANHPVCDKCCRICEDICNRQQYCLVEEAEEEQRQAEETENDRRESICKEWRDCEHKEICFTPQNEEAGICFADEPQKIPAEHRPLFSRDELKILAAGFHLVRYTREEKKVEMSESDPTNGWMVMPEIVCLCGSTRFGDAFRAANLKRTLEGQIVLSIGCDMRSDAEIFADKTPEELERIKADLYTLHLRKIDMADIVLILNVDGYIGESTRRELNYAREKGKRIQFLVNPGRQKREA